MMPALPQTGAQMVRPSGVILSLLLTGLLGTGCSSGRSASAANLCTIPLTQIIRIPVTSLGPQDKVETVPAANLTITLGATDEPPEGPTGFDVLDDGSLLITDPFRSSLSVFDAQGKFRKVWKIGFPADSVTVTNKGVVVIREASTGRLRGFDAEGNPRAEEVTLPPPVEAQVFPGKNRGTVSRNAGNSEHPSVMIELDKPGRTLLSLEGLGTDRQGDTYVALEVTSGADATGAINLNKYVRRYSSDGKLLGETAELPLNYYVAPVDELRVHNGVVYQLQTTATEVRVNLWDTKPLCSGASR